MNGQLFSLFASYELLCRVALSCSDPPVPTCTTRRDVVARIILLDHGVSVSNTVSLVRLCVGAGLVNVL